MLAFGHAPFAKFPNTICKVPNAFPDAQRTLSRPGLVRFPLVAPSPTPVSFCECDPPIEAHPPPLSALSCFGKYAICLTTSHRGYITTLCVFPGLQRVQHLVRLDVNPRAMTNVSFLQAKNEKGSLYCTKLISKKKCRGI